MKETLLAASLMTLALSSSAGEIRTRYGGASRAAQNQAAPTTVARSISAGAGAAHFSSFGSGFAPSRVSAGRFHGRRLGASDQTPAGQDPQTQSGPAPQFGALIQTAHPTKIGPENPQVFHVVDGGGDFMRPEQDKSQRETLSRGVHMGKADTPPSSGGGASGKNAITAIPNPGEE